MHLVPTCRALINAERFSGLGKIFWQFLTSGQWWCLIYDVYLLVLYGQFSFLRDFFPLFFFFFYSTSTFDLTAALCNPYYGILWPCKLIYKVDKLEGYNQTEEICNFLTSNSAIWPRWCSLCILKCMWFWLQNNRFQERNSSKEKKEDHEQIFASKSPNHYLCINAITSESVALWIYQILNWLENVKIIEIA